MNTLKTLQLSQSRHGAQAWINANALGKQGRSALSDRHWYKTEVWNPTRPLGFVILNFNSCQFPDYEALTLGRPRNTAFLQPRDFFWYLSFQRNRWHSTGQWEESTKFPLNIRVDYVLEVLVRELRNKNEKMCSESALNRMFWCSKGRVLTGRTCGPLLACSVRPPALHQSLSEPNGLKTCFLRGLCQTTQMSSSTLLRLSNVWYFSLFKKTLVL